jgi:hypothetical protein
MKVHVPSHIRHESLTAYALEDGHRTMVRFWDSGRKGRIGPEPMDEYHWRDLLRWGAPLALAPQGQVTLHGSCVSRDGSAIAFMGVGGAGKSTLADELVERGWERLADDMIVCDPDCRAHRQGELVLREWIDGYAGDGHPTLELAYNKLADRLAETWPLASRPLATLYFLDEARHPGDRFLARRLSATDCFCRLRQLGFGGLPCPDAWANQFRVYGALASRVPASVLCTPAGLEKMRVALPQLEEQLCALVADQPAAVI